MVLGERRSTGRCTILIQHEAGNVQYYSVWFLNKLSCTLILVRVVFLFINLIQRLSHSLVFALYLFVFRPEVVFSFCL